jgi:hypothetical protein
MRSIVGLLIATLTMCAVAPLPAAGSAGVIDPEPGTVWYLTYGGFGGGEPGAIEGYMFDVYGITPDGVEYMGDAGVVTVVGREATPKGQDVYFKHIAYFGGPREVINFLLQGDLFQLSDGKPGICYYDPACSTYVVEMGFHEGSNTIFKFRYIGDFSGNLDLVVRCGLERTVGEKVYLDLGLADCDYYQVATVTGAKTLDLRVAPTTNAAAIKTLRRGEMFYLTGRVEYYWPPGDRSLTDVIPFYEAIYGEAEGWVAHDRTISVTEKPFFETGGFAALSPGKEEE